ncbi:MAG: energy transducer TonB [Candidatus Zhuqueibacterota bacterium]
MEPEKRIEFELVETPENSPDETPASETDLVSDKNSRARDMNSDPSLPIGNPYSEGDFDVKEVPEAQSSLANQQRNQSQRDESEMANKTESEPEELGLVEYTHEKFSRKQLMADGTPEPPTPQQRSAQKPLYENTKFSADELGGFSFNTYEWDFAPYMLEMKRKVEKNVFPPPAFTHMGLISGETILRFKVMPNGEVKDLEVLKYNGHESLMETSLKAIQISSPFRNLPADFPENYLEVTASFTYFIKR